MGVKTNNFTITFDTNLISSCNITGPLVAGSNKNDGVSITTQTSTELVFDAQCDRNGQTSVANDWNAALDNSAMHMNSYQLIGHNGSPPDSLNFYFPVTMTIDGLDYDCLIGQGNYGVNHNWWIGSLNMYTVVQGKIGVNLLGFSFLMQKMGGLKLLPAVNVDTFIHTDTLNISNLYDG